MAGDAQGSFGADPASTDRNLDRKTAEMLCGIIYLVKPGADNWGQTTILGESLIHSIK